MAWEEKRAAKELTDAILINPYSIEEFSDAVKRTVEMPPEEKKKRIKFKDISMQAKVNVEKIKTLKE